MGIKPDNDGRCGFTAPHEGKRVCACLLRLRRGESVPYRNGLRTRKGRRIGSGVFPRYVPAYRTARLGYTGRYRSGTALDDQVQERISESDEVFKFVHFCAPQNSQEKYSEPLNGSFKTTIAHKNHEGVGRWYNKGARRVDQKKISDSSNHTWEDKKYYTFEELVADDIADNREWNHSPHPNQKKYPGMTRWEVLVAKSTRPCVHSTALL